MIARRSVSITLVILGVLLATQAVGDFRVRCKNLTTVQNQQLQQIWNRLDQRSKREDIESDLKVFLSRLQSACQGTDAIEFQIAKEGLLRKNYLYRAHHLLDQLERRSRYRSVKSDLTELRDLSIKLNVPIQEFISDTKRNKVYLSGEASSQTRKAACSDVDFRPNLRSDASLSMETPICTSYSAADLLSFALGKTVSSIGIARANYGDKSLRKFVRVSVGQAIRNSVKKGIYLEDDVPSNAFKELLERELNSFGSFNFSNKWAVAGTSCEQVCNPICLSRFFNSRFSIETKSGLLNSKQSLMKILDRQLEGDQRFSSGRIVAIDYSPSFIVREKYEYRHSAIVVGRQFNRKTGGCEYLVRNHWEGGCKVYLSSLKCENGDVWIPEEDLQQELDGLTYLSEKGDT